MEVGRIAPETPNTYRLVGALMIGSGLMNAGLAALWVFSLVWVCVGLLWIVPLAVALGEVLVGALMVAGVPIRFAPIAAGVGIVNGSLLFSPPAVVLQVLALIFAQQEDCRRFVALPGPSDGDGIGSPPPPP